MYHNYYLCSTHWLSSYENISKSIIGFLSRELSWVGYLVPIVLILLVRCRHRFLPTAELDISTQCRVTSQISRLTFSQISAYVCILIKNIFNSFIIIQKLVFCCHKGSIQKGSLSQKKCLLSGAALDISSMFDLACPCFESI